MPILANRAMVSCTRRVPLTMVRDAHLPVILGILLIPETSVVMQMVYGSQATLRVKVKYFIFVVFISKVGLYGASSVSKMLFYFKIRISLSNTLFFV